MFTFKSENVKKAYLFKVSFCVDGKGKIIYFHNQGMFAFPWFPDKTKKNMKKNKSGYVQAIFTEKKNNVLWCM